MREGLFQKRSFWSGKTIEGGHLLKLCCMGLFAFLSNSLQAQTSNTGCVGGGFGIDAGLYSNTIEFGTGTPAAGSNDWFTASGGSGVGVVNVTTSATIQALLQGGGNPTYETRMSSGLNSIQGGRVLIDAVFARDNFGGSGHTDQTAYETASKNGEDPAIWDPGPMNVLGKNDLIDVAGHMFRAGTTLQDDLWFVGMINRAEPGGDAYLDFEFYVQEVTYNASTGFSSGGPDLGHTAFQFDGSGNITRTGDLIFTCDLLGGGTDPEVNVRIWVSYADFLANRHPPGFMYGPEFDGAFQKSPYGYARIIPTTVEVCSYVNRDNENPAAPPWGTLNTKSHVYGTSYIDFSVAEMGINMSTIGLDPNTVNGVDSCAFPYLTYIVKSRASNSFTAQLKDFGGPYSWGRADVTPEILGNATLSCLNETGTLFANPPRTDVNYQWSTIDGNILTSTTNDTIVVDRPGTYTLDVNLPTGCPLPSDQIEVTYDPTKPFYENASAVGTVACNGNDGTIQLTVTGGTPTYTYSWSNGASTQNLSGLSPGTYTVTVSDNNTCTITTNATVAAAVPIVITPTQTNLDCFGDTDGSLSLSVTGNTPLSYVWSNGNLTAAISNLSAGNYSVTVTDADDCTETASYTLTAPTQLSASMTVVNDTDPSATDNGSITLTVSGGTPSYMFSWAGPSGFISTSQNLTGLGYGSYAVTVTDANNCIYIDSTFIYEPEICTDGIDNDGDGLNNCDDSDCQPDPPVNLRSTNASPCITQQVSYAVDAVSGITYNWTFPSNAAVQSYHGTGQDSVVVIWNSTAPGRVCVQAQQGSCTSANVCLSVNPEMVPIAPVIINNN